MSNHYVVLLKRIQYFISIIPQVKKKKEKSEEVWVEFGVCAGFLDLNL